VVSLGKVDREITWAMGSLSSLNVAIAFGDNDRIGLHALAVSALIDVHSKRADRHKTA
jgi:hypothetical protein